MAFNPTSFTRRIPEQTILVRSRDRIRDTENSSEFSLYLSDSIQGHYVLRFATIPNSIYTIDERNNTITHNLGTYVIPSGNYTGTELAAQLDADLKVGGFPNIIVTYNSKTMKLEFDDGVVAPSTTFITFTLTRNENEALPTLGFPLQSVITGTTATFPQVKGATPTTTARVIQLADPVSLGIRIKEAPTVGFMTGGKRLFTDSKNAQQHAFRNVTGQLIVPFLASEGVYQYDSYEKNRQFFSVHTPTRYLHFRVIDPDDDRVLNLNGGEWEMVIERVGRI